MSKHDYSQDTVSAISEAILNSKDKISNTVLSIETMPYSWDTGIIHNVVTWFEVEQILASKQQAENQLEKEKSRFEQVQMRIKQTDESASSKLETIRQTAEKCKKIVETLSRDLEDIIPGLKI